MASEEQRDSTSPNPPLYDYIYRDSNRIASYYAQFFEGLLEGVERSSAKKGVDGGGIQGDSSEQSVLSESRSNQREISSKETLSPHDLITTDVVSRLLDPNVISTDIENAANGAIVLVKGTVIFVDRHIPQAATTLFSLMAGQGTLGAALGASSDVPAEFVPAFMQNMTFPSAFLLQLEEPDQYDMDIQVVGTLKDAGMEEPISSNYFKYGADGIPEVYLLGIKEERNSSITIPDTKLLGMGQEIARLMSDMMFPDDAIRVTPIAMFRRLRSNENTV